VPSSSQAGDQSRPANDGTLSSAMVSAIREAEMLGLTMYQDVSIMENSFKCLSWCFRVMELLSRQPKSSEIEAVVLQAATLNLKLPEDKAIRSLRSLMQRANAWQTRVTKVLAPVPGEGKPYDFDELNELARAADDIPLCMPLESRLLAVIDDNGARHCVCCGPSDGRLMVSCDRCNKWFHGHCVHVSKEAVEALGDGDEWVCPFCLGNPPNAASLEVEKFQDKFDVEEDEDIEHDVAPKAPKADEMWPPFGLLGSEKAQEALGKALCDIPDDCGPWDPPALSRPSALPAQLPSAQSVVPSVPATSQSVISTIAPGQVASSAAAPVRQSVVSSVPARENAVPSILARKNAIPSVPARQSDFSSVPTIAAWPQPISNSHVYPAFSLTMMQSLPRYAPLNASTYMGNSVVLAGNGALQPAERKAGQGATAVNTSGPTGMADSERAAPSTMEMGMGHGSAAYSTGHRTTSRPASPPPNETNLNDMTPATVRDVMVAPVNNSSYN
jgi:PHD-finger